MGRSGRREDRLTIEQRDDDCFSGIAGYSSHRSRFVGRRGVIGIERFAGLEHAEA